jgi:DDE_Tnp_1-associated
MIAHSRPLIEVFAAIPALRKSRGKRHPLTALFALACWAMLCGYRSYSAMAEWGRNYGARLAQALGFTHATPCAATLHMIFRRVHHVEFEARLGAWAASVVEGLTTAPEAPEVAMALDGKMLRGSKKQGAPGTHLLSVLAHYVGVTLAQQAVDDKTNEITAVETLVYQLVLEGR